ncbi:MAG: histidinol-phosphatase [uncultured bacterium]|nr:MAG: histidinol-phosphatase [uncultured bacterium]HBH17733.1 D,D-heptose 1,7-bisphosphate phosphatase [Cyanobacteria bacterium UBA9579]
MNKAVFFDRDGVLNADGDYVTSISYIDLYDSSADIVAYCRNLGFKIIIVTNQPVIARGIISEQDLIQLHQDYQSLMMEQNKEAKIDKIYYCPHHPNANIPEYRINCNCRKPKPGMILQAQEEFDIDLKNSFMIGDRISDIIAGYLAGCKTVQCLTGKHTEELIQTDLNIPDQIKPDYAINDISELKGVIK